MALLQHIAIVIGSATGGLSLLSGVGMIILLTSGDSLRTIPVSRTITFGASLASLLAFSSAALLASASVWHIAGLALLATTSAGHSLVYRTLSPGRRKRIAEQQKEQKTLETWNGVVSAPVLGPAEPLDNHCVAVVTKTSTLASDGRTLLASFTLGVAAYEQKKYSYGCYNSEWNEYSASSLADLADPTEENYYARAASSGYPLHAAIAFYKRYIEPVVGESATSYHDIPVADVEDLANKWTELKVLSEQINEAAYEDRQTAKSLESTITAQKELLASLC